MILRSIVLGAVAAFALHAQEVTMRDVTVPMRDGVILRADVLRPVGDGPFPVLVYRTPYGEVIGAIEALVHVSTDGLDLDLWVKLMDVAPDGTTYNLMSPGLDVIRASYRDTTARSLLTPGRVYPLRLDNLITANTFKKGHRIRAYLSTTFFPHFSRNLHTGDLETTSARSRPARVTVHHDARYPSRIILPVLPRRP